MKKKNPNRFLPDTVIKRNPILMGKAEVVDEIDASISTETTLEFTVPVAQYGGVTALKRFIKESIEMRKLIAAGASPETSVIKTFDLKREKNTLNCAVKIVFDDYGDYGGESEEESKPEPVTEGIVKELENL